MPALGNHFSNTYTMRDYTGEVKSFSVGQREVNVLSLPDINSELAAFETALDAITLGVRAAQVLNRKEVVSNAKPASKYAQIESELLVRYRGVTTEAPFSVRIPTVDANVLNFVDGAEDQVIISGAGASAATTAFITAFETAFRNPDDSTEGIEVYEMRFVGSNS